MQPYRTPQGSFESAIYVEISQSDVASIACGIGVRRDEEPHLFEHLYELGMRASITPFLEDDLNLAADGEVINKLIDRTREYLEYDFIVLDPEQSYDTESIKATQFAVLAAKLCRTDHTPDEESPLVIVRGNEAVASRVKEGLRDFTFRTPPVTYSTLLYRYALPAHIARLAAKYLESRVEQAPDSPTPKIEEQRGETWKTVVEAR